VTSEHWKGRRVLITGHTGFKGAWLVQVMHRLGVDICGYALAPNTSPSLYDAANITKLCRSEIGDIRDRARLLGVVKSFRPEVVFHLAAQPLVRVSYRDPFETYSVNVMGLITLFEVLREAADIRCVVNVTSDKCYENLEWDRGYQETDAMGGYDPYSSSKACSELITASWRRSFFDPAGILVASGRAGNVIGGGDWAEDRLIPDFIRSVENGDELTIRSPRATRPWQHVLEPLSGYIGVAEKLLDNDNSAATGWNFGPEDESVRNVEWVAETICQYWGNGARVKIAADASFHEAHNLMLDIQKAKKELGWVPRWNVSDALFRTVYWHRSFSEGQNARLLCLQDIDIFDQSIQNRKGIDA
jgi:CDP-glucose 4,6-dehydratase